MERMLRLLITAVARLALPSDAQRQFLERIRTAPLVDELLLEAGQALEFRPALAEAGLLTLADEQRLQELYELLREIDMYSLHRVADLTAPPWNEVRRAAREFLFGEEF